MKKVLAILLSSMIVLSGLHLAVSSHFCSKHLVAVRISVSNQLASCGMEQSESDCPTQDALQSDCCHDSMLQYQIDENYAPSFSVFHALCDYVLYPVQWVQVSAYMPVFSKSTLLSAAPPFYEEYRNVSLSRICVFRI